MVRISIAKMGSDESIPSKDSTSLQDTCPTATPFRQAVFINGFPCKNPANIIASDFKTSRLNHAGNTDNFRRSATSMVTAAEFPGLNTLGLSIARTDIAVDGLVFPHAHPRASEMFYVSRGVVIAGFIDTRNQLFQKTLREGDVVVFPRGLLHFSLNAGFDLATIFSVLNSQNPGTVSSVDAMFEPAGSDALLESLLRTRLLNLSATKADPMSA
ncbi:hypothetical protein HHK36_007690 [Tetracentron sinense]|uniref:Germin-like protein n=1 Tax=Tetracentron sinense TaxID=13715 RepID=A0A834ZJR9_TETSI|nr:hypothetical protein HHK36_007690 [Tetracentron sinense]